MNNSNKTVSFATAGTLALSMLFSQESAAAPIERLQPFESKDRVIEQSYADAGALGASTKANTRALFDELKSTHPALLFSTHFLNRAAFMVLTGPLQTTYDLMKQKYPDASPDCNMTMNHFDPAQSDFLDFSCKTSGTVSAKFEYDMTDGDLTVCSTQTKKYLVGKSRWEKDREGELYEIAAPVLELKVRSCISEQEGLIQEGKDTYASLFKDTVTQKAAKAFNEGRVFVNAIDPITNSAGQSHFYYTAGSGENSIAPQPDLKDSIREYILK